MNYSKPYTAPILTVDLVCFQVINKELCVLLQKRQDQPFKNDWALPGGYNPEGETTIEALARITKNKTGLDIHKDFGYLEQLYTFDTVARDPRGHAVSVTYIAGDYSILVNRPENEVRFFPVTTLPRTAFDHKEIVNHAYKRLRSKLLYTNVSNFFLPKEFTLTQMQILFETILDKKLDKRNFRKKILSTHILKALDKYDSVGAHRPAQLYSFKVNKLIELPTSFE